MDDHPETTVGQILEFNAVVTPELFDGMDRRAPRFGVTLLQFMDGTLRHPHRRRQFALTAVKRGARHPQLGGESEPFEPNEFAQMT